MPTICPRCSELLPDDAGFCPFDGAELQKSSDRFLGKTIAARYRLTKKLGSGGMSVVYLARHELISRLSAIKILRPELSRMPEHRERFLREARAVNRINHPNIVEITDVGESDGVAYLVMEYVEGESLLAQIQKGPLRWERAIRIALQVASALARTHQTGIIHRDLKPENILLLPRKAAGRDEAASPEHVKLTDFGIAKMMGEPTLTLNEQLFGTPGYIAPEYVGGLPIDGRADIYSLAVVLYEMVTGQLPFEGRGQSDLLLKPLTSSPIPPSKRIAGLPPDLELLLLRCLAREPKHRPHDAFALHDALADLLRRFETIAATPAPEPARGSIVAPAPDLVRVSSAPRVSSGVLDLSLDNDTIIDRASSAELLAAAESARATVGKRADDPARRTVGKATGTGPVPGTPGMAARAGTLGKIADADTISGWSTALVELETAITRARRAGGSAVLVGRAADLALVASEMVPRVERATKVVADLQTKVDRLQAIGREFRANLGHAIDVLVHDRSRERAHLDALRTRREDLQGTPAANAAPPPWEVEALVTEERRTTSVVADLDFQIATLQKQLDEKNEQHEDALVQATGTLEGSLSALRHLTNEVARALDDSIDMLQRAG